MNDDVTAADICRNDVVRFSRFGAGDRSGRVLECYATNFQGGDYVEVLLQESPESERGEWYRLPAELRVEIL